MSDSLRHVPLYSSKYSRRDFTLWQHIALIPLMQRIRKSYREYVDDYLTTTERPSGYSVFRRKSWRGCWGGFIHLTRIRVQVFSPDSSGFSPHHASMGRTQGITSEGS